MSTMALDERSETFTCFGSNCGAWVIGASALGDAGSAVAAIKERLLRWHRQFSRFEPDSELSRLNRDPRGTVPVSADMIAFATAAIAAAALTDGLVDPTLLSEIERAGYDSHHDPELVPELVGEHAGPRAPARPHPAARWRSVVPDPERLTITRPPGVMLDSGGIAKGLFADLVAAEVAGCDSYAIDCGGDLMIGGVARIARGVEVRAPAGGGILHTFELIESGVATSGIAKRSWLDRDGRRAHHLLDPATGRPAYTGLVQVTALAPSSVEAEARAKAALLSGPRDAPGWLPHGGLIVDDAGTATLIGGAQPAARS